MENKKSSISSHALDTVTGKPCNNLKITLYLFTEEKATQLYQGRTNKDGRITGDLFPKIDAPAIYKVRFDTEDYFINNNIKEFFYPFVEIVFKVEAGQHYHIPLLLSPFGYSTYRGS
eukprot:TRINITY_DN1783_c0_g1_i1.p2 TRINITY_DN1783_c0_g1~~TRINITY_DN1783_c0_g1_i1.p2  ORF type:complete len:117 (-),score=34.54 TRINITY_DN1783_c0_g1_i1:45-395(-)